MSWLPRKCILVPVDFSEESLRAVDVALDIGGGASKIRVVHALPEITVIEPSVAWDTLNDEARCESAEKGLQDAFKDTKYKDVHPCVIVGDPGHGIADHAQEVEADLIVMPSHGRTGLKRLLIGSVAERVVRLAHCPVLVLRN